MNNIQLEEDEIDLKKLFLILWNKKVFIVIFTLIVTAFAIVFVSFKNTIPLYKGSLLIEIGEIKSSNPNQIYFDNPNNLKNILEQKFDVSINVPRKTSQFLNSLIYIEISETDKMKIKNNINEVKDFIIKRHKEKAKLYNDFIMTKQIGDININPNPINKPKKQLIILSSFITGFILSIFIILIMQFITSLKEEK